VGLTGVRLRPHRLHGLRDGIAMHRPPSVPSATMLQPGPRSAGSFVISRAILTPPWAA